MRPSIGGAARAAALALGLSCFGLAPSALAADAHGPPPIPNTEFSFQGIFGTFDKASAQRGAQVYTQVCANCHSLRLLSYRNLRDIGLNEQQVAAIAASVEVDAAPNDQGVVAQRPGRPSDRFRSPFRNEAAGRAANGGAYPPDLSVMVKAREGGADYIHALLIGYEDPPEGVTVPEGMYYNKYYNGHMIAMPAPLQDGQQTFADGSPNSVDAMSKDVSTFLAWASEPELDQRHAMGVRWVLFLSVLGGLVYAVKRKVWADLKPGKNNENEDAPR